MMGITGTRWEPQVALWQGFIPLLSNVLLAPMPHLLSSPPPLHLSIPHSLSSSVLPSPIVPSSTYPSIHSSRPVLFRTSVSSSFPFHSLFLSLVLAVTHFLTTSHLYIPVHPSLSPSPICDLYMVFIVLSGRRGRGREREERSGLNIEAVC